MINSSAENGRAPEHIAIIMDGNGRWATKRGLPRSAGHKEGAKTFRKIADHCQRIGVGHLTVYAFSTENWKRPKEEVDGIFLLLRLYIKKEKDRLIRDKVRLRFIGDLSRFPKALRSDIDMIHQATGEFCDLCVNIAINYGGREEIIHASRELAKKVKSGEMLPSDITEEVFSGYTYTRGQPDPDLIIRPSGELRLSNFLLWQCAYAELWFSDILWPDFSPEDLDAAIADFMKRQRRFGGI